MAIVYSEKLLEHSQWPDHPESPLRLKTLRKKLEKEGLWKNVVDPDDLPDEALLRVHTEEHVEKVRKGGDYPVDPDTFIRDDTYELAKISAAVAVKAVELAVKGEPSVALTRPPGHHAGKNRIGGFCYFNNVAVAVAASGKKTAIIDLDAHHGNGTEEIFYDTDQVLVISTHEADFYWDSGYVESMGEGKGSKYNVNIPIPAGAGNRTFLMAMDEIIIPVIEKFEPELIVVSLGVDAHYCEPNAHMQINTHGYIQLCRRLFNISGGKIAFVLEGGYHLRATAEVMAGVLAMMEGRSLKAEYDEERCEQGNGRKAVRKVKEYISKYWNI
ncbi:MAG: histone deacetylase [Thermoplasmatales archaeon]|nr:histone deacetylase [Thermoplasmatales archaeon]